MNSLNRLISSTFVVLCAVVPVVQAQNEEALEVKVLLGTGLDYEGEVTKALETKIETHLCEFKGGDKAHFEAFMEKLDKRMSKDQQVLTESRFYGLKNDEVYVGNVADLVANAKPQDQLKGIVSSRYFIKGKK